MGKTNTEPLHVWLSWKVSFCYNDIEQYLDILGNSAVDGNKQVPTYKILDLWALLKYLR